MSFSSLLLESFALCSFRNVALVFPTGFFTSGLLRVSFGYLRKNGRPLSISVSHFRLFLSFSLPASDLGNDGQTHSVRAVIWAVPWLYDFLPFNPNFHWKKGGGATQFVFVKGVVLVLQLILFRNFSGHVIICRRRGKFGYC